MRTSGALERTFIVPTRQLPSNPSLQQLKEQAKDLLRDQRAHLPQAVQRIREFHPRFRRASDASIAGAVLKLERRATRDRSRVRILVMAPAQKVCREPQTRRVQTAGARAHPGCGLPARHRFARRRRCARAACVPGGESPARSGARAVRRRQYFQEPALLEFIAENPTRHGSLPANAAEIARVILDAGGKDDLASLDSALALRRFERRRARERRPSRVDERALRCRRGSIGGDLCRAALQSV